MTRSGTIYLLTNTVTGKVYVGQTWRTPARRWSAHVARSRKVEAREPLMHAIRLHGPEAFTLTVLHTGITTQAELSALEQTLIASLDPASSYNAAPGGEGGATRTGAKLTVEIRTKIAASRRGQMLPEEHRQKIAAALIGNKSRTGMKDRPDTLARKSAAAIGNRSAAGNRSNLGRTFSPEVRQRMREAALRRWHPTSEAHDLRSPGQPG